MDRTTQCKKCVNCKYAIQMHKRYYTYDNRLVDYYKWGCAKNKRIDRQTNHQNTCSEWKKTVNI